MNDSFCGGSANWTECSCRIGLLSCSSAPPTKVGSDPPNHLHLHHHSCGACRLWASSLFFHPASVGARGQGHSTEPSSDCLKLKYTCFLDFCSQREIAADFFVPSYFYTNCSRSCFHRFRRCFGSRTHLVHKSQSRALCSV